MPNDPTFDNRSPAKDKNLARKPQPSKPRRKHTAHWRLLTMLATLAILLWLAPAIIAKTPLLPWVVKLATADLQGTATIRTASLGWLSPVEAQGIEIKDKAGKPILSIDKVVGDRTLGAILFNYTRLGKFTLTGAKASVVIRDDGSNVEDALAKYLEPKKKPSTTDIGLAIEIRDGNATVTDELTGLQWQIEKLSVGFDMQEGQKGPLQVDLATNLYQNREQGRISAAVKMGPTENSAKLSVSQFPLGMLRAVAARVAPGTKLSGRLSSEIVASWGDKAGSGVAARLSIDTFSLGMTSLQQDSIRLASLQADCQATWQTDRIDIEKSSLQCDVGNASLAGAIPLGGKDGFSLTSLLHQRQQFNGTIDLARLAQLLPVTLHLRSNMHIDSGQVQWAFGSQPGPQGTVWHGQCEAGNLAGTASDGGSQRRIVWNRPITAVFDAHDASGGDPIVDRLQCDSDFLHVDGAGTTNDLAATFSLSLDRLVGQLNQFVDFGSVQMAGDGSGSFAWKRSPQHDFDTGLKVDLRGFQLGMTGQPLWREDGIQVQAVAKGRTEFDANTRVETATLSIRSAADQFSASLLEPVKDMKGGGIWSVGLQSQGQLQNWPGRLAALFIGGSSQFAGGFILEANGVASAQTADLRQFRFAAAPLRVTSPLANINEDRIDITVSGSWDANKRRLQVPAALLKCNSVNVDARDFVVALSETGATELVGTINYQADAGRVGQWFADANSPTPWRLAGRLEGSTVLKQTGSAVHGATTAKLTNLAVTDSQNRQINEPVVQLVAQADYDAKTKTIQLTQCELTSSALTAAAVGRVLPDRGQDSQVEGKIRYDLARVCGLLRPCIGPNVNLTGAGSSDISFHGPFTLAEASGATQLHCDAANLWNFPLGAADVKATMAKGVLAIEPVNVALCGGTVRLAPRLQLNSSPMVLTMPSGPVAQRIQISPAMCGSMLQFAAPMLAGATTAQGSFSVDLDQCSIPIGDLKKANVAGRFTVHSMVIGPGRMTQQFATFMNRAAPAQLKQESVVPFQMVNGRVYHRNLELQFPDITIRSSGSVGVIDQTLDITAEMPVPAKWQAGTTVLANAAKNQTIVIPLRGTLAKPALDQKVVQDLTKQFMKKAAGNIIEGELNRLLTPRK